MRAALERFGRRDVRREKRCTGEYVCPELKAGGGEQEDVGAGKGFLT